MNGRTNPRVKKLAILTPMRVLKNCLVWTSYTSLSWDTADSKSAAAARRCRLPPATFVRRFCCRLTLVTFPLFTETITSLLGLLELNFDWFHRLLRSETLNINR
ncbi:hypothetical protein JCGZ_17660 [Jatropha curcas]|uniref:Uncharacterized protein n=1 Tax=Jatropha curcas TaxID=180498 RepID=A0A067JRI6_JATCU|nr:hypothetical protein JCGZ_17660 [Jatropha curcas]